MDRENHAGLIIVFLLIFALFAGLFVYTHFILGEHTHKAAEDDWVVETAATCNEQGYKYQVCTTCGISFNGRVIDALGHDFADPIKENVVEATCTAGGSYDMTSYCSRCGEIDSKESFTVDILEHKGALPVWENVQEPTCTESGSHDEVVYCAGCNKFLSKEVGVIDDPVGHTPTEPKRENIVGAGCESTGSYDEVISCGVCGVDYSHRTVTVEAEGHAHEAVEFKIGNDNKPELHTECSKCQETNVITSFTASELVRADDDLNYPLPTCVDNGLGKYEINIVFEGCVISETFDNVIEPALGHCLIAYDSYGNPYNILTTAWNFDANGNEIYGLRFDKDLKREYYDVSTPGLTVVVDESKGQTYDSVWDENGYAFASYKCSRCGKWFIVDVYNAEYDSRVN